MILDWALIIAVKLKWNSFLSLSIKPEYLRGKRKII